MISSGMFNYSYELVGFDKRRPLELEDDFNEAVVVQLVSPRNIELWISLCNVHSFTQDVNLFRFPIGIIFRCTPEFFPCGVE